ncbi:MAG TPA: NUDIX hydrolase [Acidobacteriota bacterium]|nr:NUDIX hydrolase [Acidobacteriota bacterium]
MKKLKSYKVLESKKVYQGKVVDLVVDTIEIGGKEYIREAVRHPGGVVILGRRPDGRIPFVRQHRYPPDEIVLELPAGKLDEGEEPNQAAARELEEETGYRAAGLRHVSSFYSTPGFCDEILHFFHSDTLTASHQSGGEEDEILQVEFYTLSEALELATRGKIRDAKTLVALYWLRINDGG